MPPLSGLNPIIYPGFSPGQIAGLQAWYSANYGVYQDGAAHFTAASSQYLYCADNASLSMGSNTNFTIAAWVYADTQISTQTVLAKWGGAGQTAYAIYMPSNIPTFIVSNDGTATTTVNTGSAMAAGGWHFLAAWYDGANINISIDNGTTHSTAFSAGVFDNTAQFQLSGISGGQFWNGSIDSVFVTKRVLTAAERTWLYNSGNGQVFANVASGMPSLNDASAISWWDLNEESGTRFDQIGTNDLTASNVALISPTVGNGGFETAGATPPAFANWSQSVGGTDTLTRDTVVFHSGTASAKFVIDVGNDNDEITQAVLRVGDNYAASLWGIGALGGEVITFGEGSPYSGASSSPTLTASWAQYSLNFKAAVSTLFSVRRAAAATTFNIDDVTVTDLGPVGIAGIAAGIATDGNFCGNFVAASSQRLTTSSSQLQCGNVDFGFFGWIYVDSQASERAVLGNSNGGGGDYLVDLVSDSLIFYSGSAVAGVSAPAIASWYFFGVWRDSIAGTINIALALDAPVSALSTPSAPGVNFALGSYPNGGNPFDGRIDSVLFCKSPPGGIAGIVSTIRTTLFNDGNGLKAKNLTPAQKTAWGVVSGWDMDKLLGITADSIGTNTLTNNNAVTFAQGVDYFGGAVSKQLDRSSAANNIVQVTEALRPVWYSRVQNNKPGILYNGVSNLLEDASASGIPVGTSARTVFQVIKQTTVQNGFPLFWNAGAANHCGININGTFKAYLEDYYDSGISIANNTAYIVAFTYDGTNLATYVNDVAGATFTPTPPIHTGTVDLSLGALPGGVIPFNGYAFDGAIYNSALTRAQITQVFNYFKQQWGIS